MFGFGNLCLIKYVKIFSEGLTALAINMGKFGENIYLRKYTCIYHNQVNMEGKHLSWVVMRHTDVP